jgi:hypothetical protein
MRKISTVLVLAVALALTLVVPAGAQTPSVIVRGRVVIDDYHFGNPNLGVVRTAIQGEELLEGTDRLRGAVRISKRPSPDGVIRAVRVQVNRVALQQLISGTWVNVRVNETDVNSGTALSALSKTPTADLCPGGTIRRYRTRATLSVRWTDNFLSVFTRNSAEFFTRANVVTGVGCP